MTSLVHVLNTMLEIPALNVRLGLGPGSQAFQKLSKSTAGAVKAVCAGARLASTTEFEVLLRLIAESALGESERDELRDLFNQKLDSSLGASNGVSKMNLTTVECPENYFTEAEWREILLNGKNKRPRTTDVFVHQVESPRLGPPHRNLREEHRVVGNADRAR